MADENCLQIVWHVEQWWVCMRTQEWCTFHGMPHHPSADMLPRYRTTRCSKSAWQVVTGSMPPSLITISSNDKRAVVNLAIVDIWLKTTTLSSFSHLFTIQMYSNGFFPVIGTHLHLQQLSTLAFRQDHGAGKVIGLHCIAEHHLPQRGGWHQRLVQQSQTQSSFVAKIFGPIFSDQLMSWNEKKLKSKLVQINRVKT